MPNNKLIEAIKNRRSIRQFKSKPISRRIIKALIDAARYAPSNSNRQPWKFLVVTSRTLKNRLAAEIKKEWKKKLLRLDKELRAEIGMYGANLDFFVTAPAVIIALYKKPSLLVEKIIGKKNADKEYFYGEVVSTSMAVQNLLLMAHACRLGACVMTGPLVAEDRIKKTLNIAPHYNICCIIPVGWPINLPPAVPRKSVDAITEFIK
jgi:nitroreductase